MFVSRDDTLVEITSADGARRTIDVAGLATASVTAKRHARAIAYELVAERLDGSIALALSGAPEVLAMIQQAICEAMREVPAAQSASHGRYEDQGLSWEAV
jgi:hypothetical protein